MSQRPTTTIITRKVRLWPEIPHELVTLPNPPSEPARPGLIAIITLLLSVVGIAVSGYIFSKIGGGSSLFFLAFMAMGAFAAVGSLLTFVVQLRTTRKERKYLLDAYKKKLLEINQQLTLLQIRERQARIELDPPFVPPGFPTSCYDHLAVSTLIQRSFDEQDMNLWARLPADPDFLSVRIGMGSRPATYQIEGEPDQNRIALPTVFDPCNEYAIALAKSYSSLIVPITLKLNEHGPIAITSPLHGLSHARELTRSMVSQLVYNHSPEDLRIIILAPQSQEIGWQWASILPHTLLYDSGQSSADVNRIYDPHALAIGPEAVVELLPLISRELGRRELLLGDNQRTMANSILPHLVIIVDHFDPAGDLDPPPLSVPLMNFGSVAAPVQNRSRLTVPPLKRPEMTLALSRGAELGVSVVCVCGYKTDIPTTSGIAIDLDVTSYPLVYSTAPIILPDIEQPVRPKKRFRPRFRLAKVEEPQGHAPTLIKPQACVRLLHPDPPRVTACDLLDTAPIEAARHFAIRMRSLWPATTKRQELRTQVDLRSLFEPPIDVLTYDPLALWYNPAFRSASPAAPSNGHRAVTAPLLRIPIGQKIGDEIQYLDLIKDGPHGLLIGQTGSGKSELLQTIITSLAIIYRPDEVTFLLIDYKAGLALEPYRSLPHTIGFLSNASSPALIQRFITMLRVEALRREQGLKNGKHMPKLIIIIDEFAEMAKRTESVLDELFTITRVGREIGMHLLLSAQRPEGIIGTKVRDYVQYRLCLRCASNDDSREVLGRNDAANLPVSIPGRGYLLHGDNQLELFQAARSTVPVPYS